MRALLWLDSGAGAVDGQDVQGHVVQARRTAAALGHLGVDAIVSADPDEDISGFDVVHGLGASRDALRRARERGTPIAVSTIYSPLRYTTGSAPTGQGLAQSRTAVTKRLRVAGSILRRGSVPVAQRLLGGIHERALLFELADLLLPNSRGEASAVHDELGVSAPTHVVPNGVDPAVFHLPDVPSSRDHVLFVGRFEPHKNQLGLIQALRGSGLPLVLVGPAHPHHPDYYAACRRAADASVHFERARSHEDLRALYQEARVHVLPSWYETTGLVSLEAALSGCHVVSTARGFASEYLLDMAEYLDPASRPSIRCAVQRAWDRPAPERLRQRVLANFTWAHVASVTAAGYRRLLAADTD